MGASYLPLTCLANPFVGFLFRQDCFHHMHEGNSALYASTGDTEEVGDILRTQRTASSVSHNRRTQLSPFDTIEQIMPCLLGVNSTQWVRCTFHPPQLMEKAAGPIISCGRWKVDSADDCPLIHLPKSGINHHIQRPLTTRSFSPGIGGWLVPSPRFVSARSGRVLNSISLPL